MAWGGKKTEHSGSKKGRGAFYGRKSAAKRASRRRRREIDKVVARDLDLPIADRDPIRRVARSRLPTS